MNSLMYVLAFCIASVAATPEDDGRYHPEHYGDSGRYNRPANEGKYIHIPNPYLHMENPYDGGYGGYNHVPDPYENAVQESRDVYKYVLSSPQDLPYYKPGYYENNGIKIINQKHNYDKQGYDFTFETENKIRQNEQAVLKNPNSLDEGIQSEGFYEYIGPDGFMYRVEYTAGVEGFRPRVRRIETPYSGKWVLEKINKY